jgi:hypothetical protein
LHACSREGEDGKKAKGSIPGTGKLYFNRDQTGQCRESDDVGTSLVTDRRTRAKAMVKASQGDRGDQSAEA